MRRNSNGISARVIVMAVALTLIIGGIIGGSVAWLTATSGPLVNTFTVGDINITLTESENLNLKMVPGNSITKDPKVTVEGGSEACWLFVKIEKSTNYGTYLENPTLAEGWEALTGVDGVYYRKVDATAAATGTEFAVLKDNKVKVKDTVTRSDMETAKTGAPTLTFTAYAVQSDNVADAKTAWDAIPATDKN